MGRFSLDPPISLRPPKYTFESYLSDVKTKLMAKARM